MERYFRVFILSFAIAAIVTPFVIKFAVKVGAVDIPKDDRRVHNKPIPLLGGLSIFSAFAIIVLVFLPLNKEIIGILLGGTFIVICGIIDDMKPLKPRVKLLLQVVASLIVVCLGVRIKFVTNPFAVTDSMTDIGFLSIPATIFWIVGVTNAFNLIDGLDGLAAGLASISCITLFIVSILNGRIVAAMLTATLAGGTLGFLPYNFNPAKIFMGDTGAMFLGFILATISIQGAIKSAAAIVITVPVLALGLPIYDTVFSIIRRFINRRPIMEGDRGHLHHRLLDMGLNQKQAVLSMYSMSALLGFSAVYAMVASTERSFITLLTIIFIVILFAWGITFLKKNKERKL